ncbi:hypothetical protein ECLT68_0569 [Escherichia coli LT-68]|nr:hypothetical protein ECLT68_0569 [Escherichia coli LT-68]
MPLLNEPNNKRYENRTNGSRKKPFGISGDVLNIEINKAFFMSR